MIQQTLERLSNLLRNESRNLLIAHGLQPVQFEILQYLSVSNRYSDTPMAVTEFLGQTKGTVSQTLKVLEKKELIAKKADTKDKRIIHMVVTDKGKVLINKLLPSNILSKTCKQLPDHELSNISSTLTEFLRRTQEMNHLKTFGECSTCIHNIKEDNNHYLCNLTKEQLSKSDIKLICKEHQPKNNAA